MRTYDHLLLAKKILNKRNSSLSALQLFLFWFGCIEPDINVFTYLRGMKGKEKLRGHNYTNIVPVMKSLWKKLEHKSNFSNNDLRLLGKFMHYACDMFTYPHNSEFTGTLKEHCAYEEALHHAMSLKMNDQSDCIVYPTKELMAELIELHDEYMNEYSGEKSDCDYIICAVKQVMERVHQAIRMPRPHYVTRKQLAYDYR